MYPFSISIDEHVPLNMSTSKIFFQGRVNSGFSRGRPKYFCREGKSGKIRFSPLETKKTTFFEKFVMGKCQISKSWSGLGPLSDAHAPITSYGKKT